MTTKGLDVSQVTHAQAHMISHWWCPLTTHILTTHILRRWGSSRQTIWFFSSRFLYFLSPSLPISLCHNPHPMPTLSLSVLLLSFLTHLSLDLAHVHPHRRCMLRSMAAQRLNARIFAWLTQGAAKHLVERCCFRFLLLFCFRIVVLISHTCC